MTHTLQTRRLTLRPLTLNDQNFIIELLNTPDWIKYIGDRNVKTAEQAKNYLENGPFKSYTENGYGLSLVETRRGKKPIGMCGLINRKILDCPDIGFAFLPTNYRKGYAFEIAFATVQYANRQLKIPKLCAITLPENERSIKLLEKLGFKYEKPFVYPDTQEVLSLYVLDLA